MKPFRYISEIEIDNMGNRGIRVRGRQGGADFEMVLPIHGEVQDLLTHFESELVRLLEGQRSEQDPVPGMKRAEQLELSGLLN
ncbi:MAG: hypothetical protein JNM63_09215 [Spirochaetia bacterium]|nr:hypothetical protein [Spirochaetia bacterium]